MIVPPTDSTAMEIEMRTPPTVPLSSIILTQYARIFIEFRRFCLTYFKALQYVPRVGFYRATLCVSAVFDVGRCPQSVCHFHVFYPDG